MFSAALAMALSVSAAFASQGDQTSTPRPYAMEISLRARRMTVPRAVMDIWYLDQNAATWPLPGQERPFLHGWSYGMEFVVKAEKDNGIFWFDWIDSSTPEGYWHYAADPVGGDYIRPAPNLGLVSFGADYAYEAPMVRAERTGGAFAMSFLVGAGLGMGILVGDIDTWTPTPDGQLAHERYARGDLPDDESQVPRVFPVVDVNVGIRFQLARRVVIRLEGGLHSAVYYGLTAGYMF